MAIESLVERVTFAGGEIGEALAARSDLAKYQIAVEALENYLVMVEGGAMRTPGTRFVLELKDQAQKGRLIPFRLSSDDYYMLVINGGKSRFVRLGGFIQNPDTTPHELTVPWVESDLPNLRASSSGNVIYVASGKSKQPQEITRLGHTSWTCVSYLPNNGPVDTQNLDVAKTIRAGAVTGGPNMLLTGVGNPFNIGHVGCPFRLDEVDLSFVAQWRPSELAIAANAQRRWNGNIYECVAPGGDAGPNAPVHTEGVASAGANAVAWKYLHSGFGYVRITGVTNGNSATCSVLSRLPDSVVSGPTYRWSQPAWSSVADVGWPEGVAFAGQRLLWGRDDILWSTSFDVHDFLEGEDEDAAFTVRLRSPDGSLVQLRWFVRSGVLILGTADIEWSVRGTNIYGALTPQNIDPVPDTNDGSIAQVVAVVDGGVMYAGKSSDRLHYTKFDKEAQGSQRLDSEEVSISARHIIEEGVVSVAWQRDPHRILWIWTRAGSLASLTFMPKQQVAAFARHPMTNGFVEDCAVIPSTAVGIDEVYFIVRRTINGVTKRYVEQLGPFFKPLDKVNPTAEGAWYLDCALYRDGAPVSTITALIHLEGQEVGVFADGAMQTRKTVAGGAITLDRPSRKVLVGIPKRARILDLPRNVNTQAGPTTALDKAVSEGVVHLKFAGGGTLSANGGEAEQIIETGDLGYGEPVRLFSGVKKIPIEAELRPEARLELINDDAMPCTVLGLSPRLRIDEET